MTTAPMDDLRSTACRIAENMPGPLRLIRLRAGTAMLELEWAFGPVVARTAAEGATDGHGSEAPAEAVSDAIVVTAPISGTFYCAPEPGASPFVRIDDAIDSGTQIGIIEAMKLMTPVQANVDGVIATILVGDAEPVQYGQPLMLLTPHQR